MSLTITREGPHHMRVSLFGTLRAEITRERHTWWLRRVDREGRGLDVTGLVANRERLLRAARGFLFDA
jgi:hypothetical protein